MSFTQYDAPAFTTLSKVLIAAASRPATSTPRKGDGSSFSMTNGMMSSGSIVVRVCAEWFSASSAMAMMNTQRKQSSETHRNPVRAASLSFWIEKKRCAPYPVGPPRPTSVVRAPYRTITSQ